jgi:hypothetical protein
MQRFKRRAMEARNKSGQDGKEMPYAHQRVLKSAHV